MPRVNIWLPEELHRQAKAAGLPISELAQQAIRAELDRQAHRHLHQPIARQLTIGDYGR